MHACLDWVVCILTVKYIGDNFVIDELAHCIYIAEHKHTVRPKTFDLLVYLLSKPNQIVDKTQLLAQVWDDVTVEEQVIFQSITELRKIFAGQTVIQTHPRKGYAWVAPFVLEKIQVEKPSPQFKASKYLGKKWLMASAVLVFISILMVFSYFHRDDNTSKSNVKQPTQTIFILPTKNKLMDANFGWVSMGIMDSLITQAGDHSNIMPLDYVLLSMRNAQMTRDYDAGQIQRLFKITNASVVVESEISRILGEYQLLYQIHFLTHQQRGVIQHTSIEGLISRLADILANSTNVQLAGQSTQSKTIYSEMFVEAVLLSQQGNLADAIQLMQTLIKLEPTNIAAYKMLIDWLQYLGKYAQALVFSQQVIEVLEQSNLPKSELYYRHAYNLFKLGDIAAATEYSKQLNQLLAVENNPFYLGFAKQLEGELLLEQEQPNAALQAFKLSLQQFERVSFSIGMTSIHCLMAKAYQQLNQTEQQDKHLQAARKVVREYEIHNLLGLFRIELDMLENESN